MRSLRPSLLKVLLLVIVASLISSVMASAAPIAGDDFYGCYGKVQPGVQGGGCCNQDKKPVSSVEGRGCCNQQNPKLASTSVEGGYGGCCQQQGSKIASSFAGRGGWGCCQSEPNKIASSFAGRTGSYSCCEQEPLKIASHVLGGKGWEKPPCETTPALAPTCSLDMPTGSVVGNLPQNTQADYAAGLIADGVIINAGTYWVTGVAKAANGDSFYRIIVACQYLYVPVSNMQPSFEAPWNGEPLPTNEVP